MTSDRLPIKAKSVRAPDTAASQNVRAPDTSTAIDNVLESKSVALLDLSPQLDQYLNQGNRPGVLGANSVGAAIQMIEQGKHLETAGKILMGHAFASLQSLHKRELKAVCDHVRIGRQTAYDYIDLFKMFQRLPSIAAIQSVIDIGVTKALALSDWDTDDLLALAAGEEVNSLTIDRIEAMSTDELRDHEKARREDRQLIEKLKASNETLKVNLKTAELKARKAEIAAGDAAHSLHMPDYTVNARHESNCITEQMMLGLRHLADVYREEIKENAINGGDVKHCQYAAGTMFHALRAVYAETQALLAEISTTFPIVTEGITVDFQLGPFEMERSRGALTMIRDRHAAQIKNRDAERKLAKKRTQGGAGRNPGYVDEE